jgi:hypothetical protein
VTAFLQATGEFEVENPSYLFAVECSRIFNLEKSCETPSPTSAKLKAELFACGGD